MGRSSMLTGFEVGSKVRRLAVTPGDGQGCSLGNYSDFIDLNRVHGTCSLILVGLPLILFNVLVGIVPIQHGLICLSPY